MVTRHATPRHSLRRRGRARQNASEHRGRPTAVRGQAWRRD